MPLTPKVQEEFENLQQEIKNVQQKLKLFAFAHPEAQKNIIQTRNSAEAMKRKLRALAIAKRLAMARNKNKKMAPNVNDKAARQMKMKAAIQAAIAAAKRARAKNAEKEFDNKALVECMFQMVSNDYDKEEAKLFELQHNYVLDGGDLNKLLFN